MRRQIGLALVGSVLLCGPLWSGDEQAGDGSYQGTVKRREPRSLELVPASSEPSGEIGFKGGLADLAAVGIDTEPFHAFELEDFGIEIEVANIGTADAAASGARLFLSPGPDLNFADDTEIFPGRLVPELPVSSVTTIRWDFAFPNLTDAFNIYFFWIVVIIDAANDVPELNEQNIFLTGAPLFASDTPLSDLTLFNFATTSGTPIEGQRFSVSVNEFNAGNLASTPSTTRLWLSLDGDFDTSDDFEVTPARTAPSIEALSQVPVRWEFEFPDLADVPSYDIYLIFGLDTEDDVLEVDEDNLFRASTPLVVGNGCAGEGCERDELIAAFANAGLYARYDDAAWRLLSTLTPQQVETGDFDGSGGLDLAVNFGPSGGLYVLYDGTTWRSLTTLVAEDLAVGDLDGNGIDDLIVDFGATGLYLYLNNTQWRFLTFTPVEEMVTGDLDNSGSDDLVLDFPDSVYALYDATTWRLVTTLEPRTMVAAQLDAQPGDDLVMAFDVGAYVFANGSTWSLLTSLVTDRVVVGDFDGAGVDDLVFDFGQVIGLYVLSDATSWSFLTSLSPVQDLEVGNFDGSPLSDLLVDLGPLGLWTHYNRSLWSLTNSQDAVSLATGNLGSIPAAAD